MNTDFAFQKGLEGLNRWVEKTDVLHIFQLNHAKTRLYLRQRLECRHRRPLSMKGPVQPVHTQGPESAKLARRSSDMLRLLADLQLLRDEGERGLGHLTPPVVDDQGMPAVGHLADFRDGGIFLLLLVGGIGDRYRGGVVFLARDDQQWSTLGVLRIDLGFRPRVEVGGGCLEERHARSGHRKRLVQLVGFVFVHRVGEGETELLVGQWDGPIVVQRVASTGDADFSAESGRGSTPRNGAASMATVTAATPASATICAMRPPKEWPMTAGFLLSWPMAST